MKHYYIPHIVGAGLLTFGLAISSLSALATQNRNQTLKLSQGTTSTSD